MVEQTARSTHNNGCRGTAKRGHLLLQWATAIKGRHLERCCHGTPHLEYLAGKFARGQYNHGLYAATSLVEPLEQRQQERQCLSGSCR